MKKAFLLLTLILLATVGFAQTKTITIPVKTSDRNKLYYELEPRTEVVPVMKTMKVETSSVVVSKEYMINTKDEVETVLTLEDGHIIIVSCMNNITLATDVVGSTWHYYRDSTYTGAGFITVYDTTFKTVDMTCLRLRTEKCWYGNILKTDYYAKIYSYSTGKSYWFEVPKQFYDKYEPILYGTDIMTKSDKIRMKRLLTYKDFKCLKDRKNNTLVEKIYIFNETTE